MIVSQRTLAILALSGTFSDLLGGLYLAYELLGGARGPLRTMTRAVTYGLVFAGLYTAGLGIPFGLIAGAGLGILLGIEFGLDPTRRPRWVSLMFAVARATVFGVAGGVDRGPEFGLLFGVLTAVVLVATYWMRFSVAGEYQARASMHWLLRRDVALNQAVRASLTALGFGIVAAVTGAGAAASTLAALRFFLVVFAVGLVAGTASPHVEAWAERMPTRRMGTVGIALIVLGLQLQSVQYWVTLLGITVR